VPPITARVDHVAAAVPALEPALGHWRDTLGGAPLWGFDNGVFVGIQVRYPAGKLELIAPPPEPDRAEGTFVAHFLDRFGAGVHHLTLKVPDHDAAVRTISAAGLDVVDVAVRGPHWTEGFLRPSQVGGLIVQVAWTDRTDEQWAEANGHALPEPAAGAPVLLGPVLVHDDLVEAAKVWSTLGASIDADDTAFEATWPDSDLSVVVERAPAGVSPGSRALRFRGTPSAPAGPVHGPAIEPA
jgi:catechol 2,3-dioxygenase-like lactoylglutathione lyase family enzyme